MEILIYIIIFIYGLIFGSFYNVVGYRLPKGLSLIKPKGSFCPNCNHELKWYELIPLISFIIQKGKCTKCKCKISLFYPLIELLTGILFLISYIAFGFTTEFALALLLSSYFVIVIVSDGRYMEIPDEVTITFTVLVLLTKLLAYGPNEALLSLVQGFTMFLVIYLFMKITSFIFKKETLGGGDIKLEFFTGALIGIYNGLFSIFIGSLIALPFSLLNIKSKEDSTIPFGPFLLLGVFIIYIFKLDIFNIIRDLTYIK